MAGIGKYTEGKKFTLKSGNTTPFKQMGSKDAEKHTEAKVGAAAMLTKKFPKEAGKYSYTKYLDKAAKASKDPYFKDVLDRKTFEAQRKIEAKKLSTKNVKLDVSTAKKASKGFQSTVPKGWDAAKKASTRYYKPITKVATKQASTLSRTSKAFSNTPKQLAKGVIKKGATRYALPVIGEALMTYDILKEGVKRVVKGIKTGKPQTRLYGKGPHAIGPEPKNTFSGKTWTETRVASKKKYTK